MPTPVQGKPDIDQVIREMIRNLDNLVLRIEARIEREAAEARGEIQRASHIFESICTLL